MDSFNDEDLKQFTIIKSKIFRDFVMNTHDLGFSDADFDPSCIKTAGMSLAGEVRRRGCEILDEAFMDAYYFGHMQATSEFFNNVIRVMTDSDNSKGERFQEISENFMKEFLSALIKTYIDSIKENSLA